MEYYQPQAPLVHTISTRHASPGREIDYLHEASKMACPVRFQTLDEHRFHGDFALSRFGGLGLTDLRAGPFVAERSARLISKSGGEELRLTIIASGTLEHTQLGGHVKLASGGGVLGNDVHPFIIRNRDEVRMLTLRIPRSAVKVGAKGIDALINRDLTRISTLFPLVMGYVSQLAERAHQLDPLSASRVGDNLADLVTAMLAEVVRQSPFHLSEHTTAALMRVHTFVEQHLANPDLDPHMVSQALRLSPRYINKLLEAEGTSLGRLIWQRRLERVAADLHDPRQAFNTISIIALARGYNDLSHFSRSFRQRYGISPREYRALASG